MYAFLYFYNFVFNIVTPSPFSSFFVITINSVLFYNNIYIIYIYIVIINYYSKRQCERNSHFLFSLSCHVLKTSQITRKAIIFAHFTAIFHYLIRL
ncbi:unnamed protein product [Phytomonas sp. Hart1]|nr:unnamed protein product [Phytomonas sp. Hart1]|eukprot:CCW67187.1 unnamed protein product [Phytomonas sp. isolate Hart1]